ncbi:MAG TPA: endonuclease/exonuclease/phosphatase family protein [Thermoleophilaceae bacterium]
MARHSGIVIRALSWNLFHGRDAPPDPALFTSRSRLLRVTERDDTHVQVNRRLLREFAATLAGWQWDIALLQEAPPGWLRPLARAAGASGASVRTSRNTGHALRALIARWNPDLVASHEGGSNQLLARPPWRLAEVRRQTLTLLPERRRMIWARLEHPEHGDLCVANLHATAHVPESAERDVRKAAVTAVRWSGDLPLVFGGDMNLRPNRTDLFDWLAREHGFSQPTIPNAIDHVLTRGLEVAEPPRRLPPEARELRQPCGRALRLSDHAPVVAAFMR